MLEIGLHYEKGGVLQKDIAANQEISYKTLDHLIHALKTTDLIMNANGKSTGYTLTRHTSEITMLDIQKAIEPIICVVDCLSVHFACDRSEDCTAKGFWGELNNQIINYFKGVTLQDMVIDQRKRLVAKRH